MKGCRESTFAYISESRHHVNVFAHDVVLSRKGPAVSRSESTRGKVVDFSARAASRLRFRVGNTVPLWPVASMITLTYPETFPRSGRVIKKHLKLFLAKLQRMQARMSVDVQTPAGDHQASGFWVLEFQKRSAPHFHIVAVGDYSTEEKQAIISRAWAGCCGESNNINHLKQGAHCELVRELGAMGSYLAKYLRKEDQKEVPAGFEDVGRFWGCWGTSTKPVPVMSYADHDAVTVARVLRRWYRAQHRERKVKSTKFYNFIVWNGRRCLDYYLKWGETFP